MKYTVEIDSVLEFPAWAGAVRTVELLRECHTLSAEVTDMLNECFGEIPDEGTINDYLWFYLDQDIMDGCYSAEAATEAYKSGLITVENMQEANGVL